MPLRLVLFDVGDTLLGENPSRFEHYARAARARGVAIEAAEMKRRMLAAHHALPRVHQGAFRYTDPWFRAFIARIFGRAGLGLADGEVAAVTEELFERFEDPRTFVVHPGAAELLEELARRGVRRGVVSNWSERLPRVLAATGLARWLDPVLCSALEGLEKPDPELFRRALARAGVAPEEALHVGDHPEKDVTAARAAGLQAIRIDHGAHTRLEPEADPAAPPRPSPPELLVPLVTSFRELAPLILERL